jgi:hypothetical protein
VQFPPSAVLFWQVVDADEALNQQNSPKLQEGREEAVLQVCPIELPMQTPLVQLELWQSVLLEQESPGP